MPSAFAVLCVAGKSCLGSQCAIRSMVAGCGSLSLSHLRCGKSTCHCAEGRGHEVWSLTFMVQGKKHVQHIPKTWVADVRRRVAEGREFQEAVREVLAANAQLLVLARRQEREPKKKKR